jgi:peptidoglycan glycosyltransferase
MNNPIRRLSTLAGFLFAVLLVSTTWIQFVDAKDLNARSDNRRTLLSSYGRERGQILVDGKPIARSTAVKDELKWQREYLDAKLYSHITGYYSFVYGTGGGLESADNALLSGQSDKLFYRRIADMFTGRKPVGASLQLTINPAVQKAADQALGNQRGAAVAIDPRTGAILALVSHPQYDPNPLASHEESVQTKAWKSLNADPARPMVDRAIAGDLYPPGSTFKLVTAAAALASGSYTPVSELPGPASLDLPLTTTNLPNHGNQSCGPNDRTTLTRALVISCNTAFGWLGMQLGADAMRAQAAKFGIGDQLSIPMRVTPSSFPADLNAPQLAQSSIGQYDVRMTPLQVAMISAAIANDGELMKPYLVSNAIVSSDLSVIDPATPEAMSQAVDGSVAKQLKAMMVDVVEQGTGRPARIDGVKVAGKTGTADHAKGEAPHAWFTGFAPADDPKIAVAVVVERGGNAGSEAAGGSTAGPIARAMMLPVVKP